MGNYHAHFDVCQHCGHPKEVLHIGRLSAGWKFVFHGYPERGIRSFEDWKKILENPNVTISDGDAYPIAFADFVKLVELRQMPITARCHVRLANEDGDFYHDARKYDFCDAEFC